MPYYLVTGKSTVIKRFWVEARDDMTAEERATELWNDLPEDDQPERYSLDFTSMTERTAEALGRKRGSDGFPVWPEEEFEK
jgi:hypothetical protein